jgi:CheY-like chemotaxis protein
MNLRILFVDDEKIGEELAELFNGTKIGDYTLEALSENSFESGLEKIKQEVFDLVVLDLCKGKASDEAKQEGLSILKDIQERTFIPIIFHTAVSHKIEDLKSHVVGVTDKKDGVENLKNEIKRLINSNIVSLKDKVHFLIEKEFKKYFWDTIHNERDKFNILEEEKSLAYLILRRLSASLSKDNIRNLVGDERLNHDVLPMEFYIYPVEEAKEFEAGDIIRYNNKTYVLLTPDCDYVERFKNAISQGRKAERILLAEIKNINTNKIYTDYIANKNANNLDKLNRLLSNNQSERNFYLPKTPFIDNSIIDFQEKIMVNYEELDKSLRFTKLDTPYAQSMITNFIRYYNRIGFPDIDKEYVISQL